MRSTARARRSACAAVLAAVLVAASCGGGGSGKTAGSTTPAASTTTTGTPTSGTPTSVTKPDPSTRLLTAAETGEGWTALGVTAPQLGPVDCGKASEADIATVRAAITAENGVQQVFRSDQSSPGSGPLKLVEVILQSDRAPQVFAAFTRVFDACLGQSWTELNKPTRLERMTAPHLGERAAAYVIISTEPATATTPELTTRGPVVVVLVRDLLVVLHPTDTQKTGSPPRLTDAQLDALATLAVDKVETHG